MNICRVCGRKYTYDRKKGHGKEVCNSCRSNINQRVKKERLVKLHGGKCCKCNYDKCISALDFHHLDPETKLFHIGGGYNRSWASLMDESNKCILVCRNCHSEIHYGVNSEYNIERTEKNKLLEIERKLRKHQQEERTIQERACLFCGKKFKPPQNKHRYCSIACVNKKQLKIEWPNKEELHKLVWEKPTSILAKEFGVSDKAIEKWCKKYGIDKPPRGYWAKKRKNNKGL